MGQDLAEQSSIGNLKCLWMAHHPVPPPLSICNRQREGSSDRVRHCNLQTGTWKLAAPSRVRLAAESADLDACPAEAASCQPSSPSSDWVAVHGSPLKLRPHQTVVFSVRPDPEPHQPVRRFRRNGPMMQPDTNRPVTTDSLEVERRMIGVGLQQVERPVGQLADGFRQGVVAAPEVRRGVVYQSRVDLPAAWSRRAHSACWSSLPARTSSSN